MSTRQGWKGFRLEQLETRVMLHGEGQISGYVYVDADDDGTRDENEKGIPGIVIRLSANDPSAESADRSTMTDDSGFYSFDELEEGSYRVTQQQASALLDGLDSSLIESADVSNDVISRIALADDQIADDNNFGEHGLRAEFISISMYLASTPHPSQVLREAIARSEELAGNSALAESIRAGGGSIPEDAGHDSENSPPVATDDTFQVDENGVFTVGARHGVLSNDTDSDNDALIADLVDEPRDGAVELNADGSFSYTPDENFLGEDSFTYLADDGTDSSNVATVTITVTQIDDSDRAFGSVTPGSFDEPGLLGLRTDLVPGAPPMTANHVDGEIDYTGYSNPPTYGDHHGFDPNGTDSNPGITPRPTGVYSSEQPDEDLIHNLEHGHVWISYNPDIIDDSDLASLENLVRDGSPDPNGGGVGVILTPRAANDTMIALVSWGRLLTLDSYDPTTIRDFVEANRGKAPEGFITP